ncbi:hypothetical protein ACXWTF_12695 [Thiomicrolovo sp. ZZH C-3]
MRLVERYARDVALFSLLLDPGRSFALVAVAGAADALIFQSTGSAWPRYALMFLVLCISFLSTVRFLGLRIPEGYRPEVRIIASRMHWDGRPPLEGLGRMLKLKAALCAAALLFTFITVSVLYSMIAKGLITP